MHAESFVEDSLKNVPPEKRAEVREAAHKATAPRMLVVKTGEECREGYVGPPQIRWGVWREGFNDFPTRERTLREWQEIVKMCAEGTPEIRATDDHDPERMTKRLDKLNERKVLREQDEIAFDNLVSHVPGWDTMTPLQKLKVMKAKNLRAPANKKAMAFSWTLLFNHLVKVGGATAAGKSFEMVCYALFGFVPIRRGGKVFFFFSTKEPTCSRCMPF